MSDEPADYIERILSQDADMLRKWIAEVESRIKARTRLTKKFMHRLETDIDSLERKERNLEIWGPGYKSSIDKMRTDVRTQINILKGEARNHEVNFWRDVSGLEKELRQLLQAYSKARLRSDLLASGERGTRP